MTVAPGQRGTLQDQYDSAQLGARYKAIIQRNPYMNARPDAAMAMAQMPLSMGEISASAAAMYGMQTADTLATQLSGMNGAAQRAVFNQLTISQQLALQQQGFTPETRDAGGDGLLGGIPVVGGALETGAKVIGAVADPVLHAVGKTVIPVGKEVLKGMEWISAWPGHLYRTIRLQDDAGQWAGLGGAILGATAVAASIAAAPFTGGMSLTTIGLLGMGAMAGASATSFLSQAAVGQAGDWIDAFNASWDGERTFDLPSQRRARELLGDPRLVRIAQDLALEDGGIDELANELAAADAAGDKNTSLGVIDKLAQKYGSPGTPGYVQAYDVMQKLITDPSFQEATRALQGGKMSIGRDFVDMLPGLDPGSTVYNVMSGSIDAVMTFAMDPTLILGKGLHVAREARAAINTFEGEAAFQRIQHIYKNNASVTRMWDGLAEAVNANDYTRASKLAPSFKDGYLKMTDYVAMRRAVDPSFVFDGKAMVEWMGEVQQLRPLLLGMGTARGTTGVVLAGIPRGSLRKIGGDLRAFTMGLADPRAAKRWLERAEAQGMKDGALEALPGFIKDQLARGDMQWDDVWKYGLSESEQLAYQGGAVVGSVPGFGRAAAQLGDLALSLTTMAPRSKVIALAGRGAERDIEAFTQLGRYWDMPSYARRMWNDAILNTRNVGERATMMMGFLDNAMTASGIKSTAEGRQMAADYLRREQHLYGMGPDGKFLDGGELFSRAIMPDDTAVMLPMPDIAEMRKAAHRGVMATLLGVTDRPMIESFTNRIWKPAVLMRVGFIFRANGEEGLNFIVRGTTGGLVQEFGARTVGRHTAWAEAEALYQNDASAVLTIAQKQLRREGPLPTFLRPVSRMADRYGWNPVASKIDSFANFQREILTEGAGRGMWSDSLKKTIAGASDGTGTFNRHNLASTIDTLVFGNPRSWRRMAAGGVDDDLIGAAHEFYRLHSTAIMREVSATTAGPTDLGSGRDSVHIQWEPNPETGELRQVEYLTMKGRWTNYTQNDPLFTNRVHHDMSKKFEDSVTGGALGDTLWQVKPESLDQNVLADLVDDYRRIQSQYGQMVIDEFIGLGARSETTLDVVGSRRTIAASDESARVTAHSIHYYNSVGDPGLRESLEIHLPENGDLHIEDFHAAFANAVTTGNSRASRAQTAYLTERPSMDSVLNRLANMTDEERAYAAAFLRASRSYGNGLGFTADDVRRGMLPGRGQRTEWVERQIVDEIIPEGFTTADIQAAERHIVDLRAEQEQFATEIAQLDARLAEIDAMPKSELTKNIRAERAQVIAAARIREAELADEIERLTDAVPGEAFIAELPKKLRAGVDNKGKPIYRYGFKRGGETVWAGGEWDFLNQLSPRELRFLKRRSGTRFATEMRPGPPSTIQAEFDSLGRWAWGTDDLSVNPPDVVRNMAAELRKTGALTDVELRQLDELDQRLAQNRFLMSDPHDPFVEARSNLEGPSFVADGWESDQLFTHVQDMVKRLTKAGVPIGPVSPPIAVRVYGGGSSRTPDLIVDQYRAAKGGTMSDDEIMRAVIDMNLQHAELTSFIGRRGGGSLRGQRTPKALRDENLGAFDADPRAYLSDQARAELEAAGLDVKSSAEYEALLAQEQSKLDWEQRITAQGGKVTESGAIARDPNIMTAQEPMFYGSLDDLRERQVKEVERALWRTQNQPQVSTMQGIGAPDQTFNQWGVKAFVVRPPRQQLEFQQVLDAADDPALLTANPEIVRAVISPMRHSVENPVMLVADKAVARQLDIAIARIEGRAGNVDDRLMIAELSRDALTARPTDGMRIAAEVQHGRGQTEVGAWIVDQEALGASLRPMSSELEAQIRRNAEQIVDQWRMTFGKNTRHTTRARTRVGTLQEDSPHAFVDQATGEIREHVIFTRDPQLGGGKTLVPVDPAATHQGGSYVNAKGQPIQYGDPVYWDQAETGLGRTGEVQWRATSRMMEDHFDQVMGRRRLAPRKAIQRTGNNFAPSDDLVPVWRSKPSDIVLQEAPDLVRGPTMTLRPNSSWDKAVRYGFDRIIGPSIDAMVRRPMAFHYFAQRYNQNMAARAWLIDENLSAGVRDITKKIGTQDTAEVSEVAEHIRRIAAYDGVKNTGSWKDSDALAWLRGHDQADLTDFLQRINTRARLELANGARPALQDVVNRSNYLLKRDAGALRSTISASAPPEEFMAYVRARAEETGIMQVWSDETAFQAFKMEARSSDVKLAQLSDDDWKTVRQYQSNWEHLSNEAGEMAATGAITDMLPFLDSHEIRSQFAEYGKGFLPFWYAEENFLRRWGRTLVDSPEALRKLQLGYMGLKHAGIVRSDEQGRDWFVYPGSGLLIDAVAKVFPGAKTLGTMLQSPTDSLLPGMTADSNRLGAPAVSPFVGISLALTTSIAPEFQGLERSVMGDANVNRDAIDLIVPNTLRQAYYAAFADEGTPQFASAMMAAIAQMEATGDGLKENATAGERQDYIDQASEYARIIMLSRAIGGFFTPGSASPVIAGESANLSGIGIENPKEVFSDQYQQLIRALGVEEGTMRFMEMNKNATMEGILNPLAYTVGTSESSSGAPLPATTQALDFFQANEDYFGAYSLATPWLLPQDGIDKRNQYAYDVQTIRGLRARRTPDEFLTALHFKAASGEYFKAKEVMTAQLDQARKNNDAEMVKAINLNWTVWATNYKAAHPIFAAELENGEGRQQRADVLTEMRVLISDPMQPQSSQTPLIAAMMRNYETYAATLIDMKADKSERGVAAVENLKARFDQWGTMYVQQNPTVAAFWQSIIRPEAGLD